MTGGKRGEKGVWGVGNFAIICEGVGVGNGMVRVAEWSWRVHGQSEQGNFISSQLLLSNFALLS